MLSYQGCTLCPRRCRAERTKGKTGFCGMTDRMLLGRAGAHYWEEPIISGAFGSGAVFFTGCTLRCAFCQNSVLSAGQFGVEVSSERLRAIFLRLIDEGVQNINLVTPTHFLPTIVPALSPKLPVPVIYNCGGYESVQTLRELEGLVDIYLPDYKYANRALAKRLSFAEDYPEVADAAIREMVRQVGTPVIEDEQMQSGVLVRHLVLPGEIDNSLGVIDWFSGAFPSGEALFSLMCQYTPMPNTAQMPPLDRRVTQTEYDAVVSYMMLCGIREGYTQDFAAASGEYIPDFSGQGV